MFSISIKLCLHGDLSGLAALDRRRELGFADDSHLTIRTHAQHEPSCVVSEQWVREQHASGRWPSHQTRVVVSVPLAKCARGDVTTHPESGSVEFLRGLPPDRIVALWLAGHQNSR